MKYQIGTGAALFLLQAKRRELDTWLNSDAGKAAPSIVQAVISEEIVAMLQTEMELMPE